MHVVLTQAPAPGAALSRLGMHVSLLTHSLSLLLPFATEVSCHFASRRGASRSGVLLRPGRNHLTGAVLHTNDSGGHKKGARSRAGPQSEDIGLDCVVLYLIRILNCELSNYGLTIESLFKPTHRKG